MTPVPPDRRTQGERRHAPERRKGGSGGPRGFLIRLIRGERRQMENRRRGWDGHSGIERRSPLQTATDLVRSAFELIAAVCDDADQKLSDESRQQLDSAFIRLKFALERLKAGQQ